MLGTCRQLRDWPKNYVSIVELSFNAIERSFQFYLVEMTAAKFSDYRTHSEYFEDIEAETSSRIRALPIESRRSARNTKLDSTTTSIGLDEISSWPCTTSRARCISTSSSSPTRSRDATAIPDGSESHATGFSSRLIQSNRRPSVNRFSSYRTSPRTTARHGSTRRRHR